MADIFAVIADPTRRELLRVLLERRPTTAPDIGRYASGESGVGEISVGEMVAELGLSQPTVSKHLRVLRDTGLVHVREKGQHRFYSLESAPLRDVEVWLEPFLGQAEGILSGEQAAGSRPAASVPAPLRRAAENLPDAADVATGLGRAVAQAQNRASSAFHDAQSVLEGSPAGRILDPVKKRLGRRE